MQVDMLLTPVVAHAGPGSTWQAMVVVAAVVLTATVLAAAFGLLHVEDRDDLVLPLAAAAILSSLAPLADALLSDAIGWALPLAVVSVVALALGALTPLSLRLPSPLAMGTLALAAVGSVVLYAPLTVALHPPADLLPLSDDSQVTITSPVDGATVPAGIVEVTVAVTGGSIGPGGVAVEDLPADPEEAGQLAVAIKEVSDDAAGAQQQRVEVAYAQTCTVADPCSQVSFDLPVEVGTHELTVDFTRGDGTPLAPFVRDRITFVAE